MTTEASSATQTPELDTQGPDLEQVDPFDPSLFATEKTASMVSAAKLLTHCKVGKPSKTSFVRASPKPEDTMTASILEIKDQDEIYLVMPVVAAAISGQSSLVVDVTLTVSIDRQGNPFLWMVRQPSKSGADNPWTSSLRKALAMAKQQWVRVEANRQNGSYDVYQARVGIADPVWPDHKLSSYLKVAFGEESIIRKPEHPVIARLLGQS